MEDNDKDQLRDYIDEKFLKIRSWTLAIICLMLILIAFSFFCCNYVANGVKIVMSFASSCNTCQIFFGIFTALILIPVAFSIQTNLRRNHFAYPMIKEIESNKEKMDNFLKNLNVVKEYWDRGEEIWLPKGVSIGNRWLSGYLPNVAFRTFVNQGYYMKINAGTSHRLAQYYWGCDQISDQMHDIETDFLRNHKIDKDTAIKQLNEKYEDYKAFFYQEYYAVNPADHTKLGYISRLGIMWEATYIPWFFNEIGSFFDLHN
jgi:hypothetical protein